MQTAMFYISQQQIQTGCDNGNITEFTGTLRPKIRRHFHQKHAFPDLHRLISDHLTRHNEDTPALSVHRQ